MMHDVMIRVDQQKTEFPLILLPVTLSGETYSIVKSLFIVPQPSKKSLSCKIWDVHGSDYKECRLLVCYAVQLLK
jgi:hypothetical protein